MMDLQRIAVRSSLKNLLDPTIATAPTSIRLIRVSLHDDFLLWRAIFWRRALRIVHWIVFAVTARMLRIACIVTTAT
jgi:hypothetical protein